MGEKSNRVNYLDIKALLRRVGLVMTIVLACMLSGCGAGDPGMNRPNLIVVAPDGKQLFILDSRNFRILVVDRKFRLVREIPCSPERSVWGMNIGTHGELVIADNRVEKATLDSDEKRTNAVAEILFMNFEGQILDTLAWRSEKGPLVYPRQVLPLADSGLAVTDLRVNKVFVFERNGSLRMTIGEFGGNDGQLYNPSDILAGSDGKLLVVDSYNHRLVEFAPNGTHLRTIGRKGSAEGELLFPQNVARDANGRIYCTELGNMRVSVFEADGRFVRHIAMPVASGSEGLSELFGIACATAPAELYVADSLNSCIHVFDLDGNHRDTIDRLRP